MHRVFIDGQVGTTGLQIHQRLMTRTDIELLEIDPAERKNPAARKALLDNADIVILCLPDDAAREAVELTENPNTRFIDASTAHRVHPAWTYGFAELTPGQREAIASARLVSNPGCYPTGFLAGLRPLVDENILDVDAQISISALSGYSGGGKSLIEKYEDRQANHPNALWHARPYALALKHKHVPEMTQYAKLNHAPVFLPIVGHFYQGMLVSTPIFRSQLKQSISADDIQALLAERYETEPCIRVHKANDDESLDEGFLDPEEANGTNRIDLFVFGHREQIVIVSRLDNLGKGASGAAVQNLNLMLQVAETEGLTL